MTKEQILDRLIKLAGTGSGRSPFIAGDLVHQDDLFDIQEQLTALMVDLGNDIGDAAVGKVVRAFPYLFKSETVQD